MTTPETPHEELARNVGRLAPFAEQRQQLASCDRARRQASAEDPDLRALLHEIDRQFGQG
jgi:hypothetical protein